MLRNTLIILFLIVFGNSTHGLSIGSYDRAALHAQKNEWDQAQTILSSLLVHDPEHVELLYDNGMAAYNKKEYAQAASYFNTVMQHPDAQNSLKELAAVQKGNCEMTLQKLDDALKSYQVALDINAHNVYAQHNKEVVKQLQEAQQQQQSEQNASDKKDEPSDQNQDSSGQNESPNTDTNNKNDPNKSADFNDAAHNNESSNDTSKNDTSKEETSNDSKNRQSPSNNQAQSHKQGNNQKNDNDAQESSTQDARNPQERMTNQRESSAHNKKNEAQRDDRQIDKQAHNTADNQKREREQQVQEDSQKAEQSQPYNNNNDHTHPLQNAENKNNLQDKGDTTKNQEKAAAVPVASVHKNKSGDDALDAWVQYVLQKQEEKDKQLNKKIMEARVTNNNGEQDVPHNW